LWLGDPPVGAAAEPWALRAVDIDLLGHVNNAAYWAAVEEQVEPGTAFAHALLGRPHRAVMEYGPGIGPRDRVELLVDESDDHLSVWFTVDGGVQAAATVVALPEPALAAPSGT
jgi:acyl-ACP thioesterase